MDVERVRVFWNLDLQYLSTKYDYLGDPKWLAFVVRRFGQKTVTEAMRRIDGKPKTSRAYFWGVCRKVRDAT